MHKGKQKKRTMRKFPYPCELHKGGCGYSPCDGLAEVSEIAYPTEDETIVYYPRCYKLQPPLILSPISEEEFERAKCGEFAPKKPLGTALEEKLDELKDTTRKTQEVVMRIDARDVKHGKQKKENDRQDKCFDYWDRGRQNPTIRQTAKGKVTYEDVFNYYKRELEEIGVKDAAEFRQLLTRRSKRLSGKQRK